VGASQHKGKGLDMKGIFYSIMIALIIIPILGLIAFYSQLGAQNIDINIRSNELYFFSESIEKDLRRFLEINGKRAMISAVSEVITSGNGLDDAQLRLVEMIENGTLYGNPAPLVDEKNIQTWEQNIDDIASNLGFNVDFKDTRVNVTQNDSFNVLFNVTIYVNISDETANMGVLKNITVSAAVSIEDIEDPIFPLKTYGRVFRFIRTSNVNKTTSPLAGQNSSNLPPNFNSGYAFVKANFQSSDKVNASTILVTDSIAGKESIINSNPNITAVVSEGDKIIPQSLTKPIISNVTNATNIIKNQTKIYLDNATMKVWDLSNLTSDIKSIGNSYYFYYHNSSKGASFLDRLEGRFNLSSKYQYGLETFVNLEEFPTELVKSTNSVLDYEYWNDIAGGSIRNGNYDPVFSWFKLSSTSAFEYGINALKN
jgi:phosphohistidine swiveling domain-containing protein